MTARGSPPRSAADSGSDPVRNRASALIVGCCQNSTGDIGRPSSSDSSPAEHDRITRPHSQLVQRDIEVDFVGTAADVRDQIVDQPMAKCSLVKIRRHTVTSNRLNSSCRYRSTQAERRILPLVVIGIEPGGTSTRSATRTLCDFYIAEATSRLTVRSRVSASSSEPPRFLSSTIATSRSVRSSGIEIAATRPPVISWIVASMSSG